MGNGECGTQSMEWQNIRQLGCFITSPSMIVKAGFPKTHNEIVLFDLKKYTKDSFEKLWPWVQDIIKKSAEWSNSVDQNPIVDDDVPF